MRQIKYYKKQPKQKEISKIDNELYAIIRTDIEKEDKNGWRCIEYIEKVEDEDFEITNSFIEQTIEKNKLEEEKIVLQKIEELLKDSDEDILMYKFSKNSPTYIELVQYRQKLRNIPKQENFPFNTIFPPKPFVLKSQKDLPNTSGYVKLKEENRE